MDEILGDCVAQSRMGNVMRRPCGNREIAPRQLVLALRAGLDNRQSIFNSKINSLMIAKLEMQEGVILDTAPVSTKKPVGADEIDRSRNVPAVSLGHDKQNVIGHPFADQGKELRGSGRATPISDCRYPCKTRKTHPRCAP